MLQIPNGIDPSRSKNDDEEPSRLQLQPLPHFPYLLSREETHSLEKWGAHAAALARGTIEPRTDKERLFTDVCSGAQAPQSRFHHTWLRYSQAVSAEAAYEAVSSANQAQRTAERITEKLEEELDRLQVVHKSGWIQYEQLKTQVEATLQKSTQTIRLLERQILDYQKRLGIEPPPSTSKDEEIPWLPHWREQG